MLAVEDVAAALAELGGNMAAVARRFNVVRSAVHAFVHANPRLLQVMNDQLEGRLDNAESALDRALNNGEAWAVCFFLKTRGKKRGYIEKQQIEHGEIGSTEVVEEVIATREEQGAGSTDSGASPVPG